MLKCCVCSTKNVKIRRIYNNNINFLCSNACANVYDDNPIPFNNYNYNNVGDVGDVGDIGDIGDVGDLDSDNDIYKYDDYFYYYIKTFFLDTASLITLHNICLILHLTNINPVYYILYSFSYISYSRLTIKPPITNNNLIYKNKIILNHTYINKLIKHSIYAPIIICIFNSICEDNMWIIIPVFILSEKYICFNFTLLKFVYLKNTRTPGLSTGSPRNSIPAASKADLIFKSCEIRPSGIPSEAS